MHTNRHSIERHGCSGSRGVKTGLVLAAVAAGATYLLFNTDKGSRIRDKMRNAAKKMKEKMADTKDKIVSSGEDLAETAKEISDDLSSLLREKRDQIMKLDRDDIDGLLERLKERWEETKDDIEETIES